MDILSNLVMPDFSDPSIWISLLTLAFLEIVLGVDNIIFISIISNKLPEHQQKRARNIGLMFAMVFRIILLLMINWIIGLKDPVFTLGFWIDEHTNMPIALSWKDLILLAGGIFLIVKSTMEIHHKMQVDKEIEKPKSAKKVASGMIANVIIQIILVDAVFSIDSILTAVGLVENVVIMIIAVIIAIGIMIAFAGAVARVINAHPSLQILALSFLVVIGVILIAEGLHQHVSKSIIYTALAFSLTVELLNIRLRKRQEKVRKIYPDDDINRMIE